MSTSSSDRFVYRAEISLYSGRHNRVAASFVAAAAYAVAIAVTGAPVALLAGLFVPLSLGTESAFRAVRPGPVGTRADALATGLGVLVGLVATGLVVFGARAVGL